MAYDMPSSVSDDTEVEMAHVEEVRLTSTSSGREQNMLDLQCAFNRTIHSLESLNEKLLTVTQKTSAVFNILPTSVSYCADVGY